MKRWFLHVPNHQPGRYFRRTPNEERGPCRVATPEPESADVQHRRPSSWLQRFQPGLGIVPFWEVWTSPSNTCWSWFPQYLGDVQLGSIRTFTNPCSNWTKGWLSQSMGFTGSDRRHFRPVFRKVFLPIPRQSDSNWTLCPRLTKGVSKVP